MTRQGRQNLTLGFLLFTAIVLVLAGVLTKSLITPLAVLAVLVLGALVAYLLIVTRARPQALTDGKVIAERLEELRAGASSFDAIWSGTYDDSEVERYFEAEKQALRGNDHLYIRRIINPTVISPKHFNLLQSIRQEFGSRFQLFKDDRIKSFELYVAHYPNERESVAVVVVNDMIKKRPKVGLVLDPGRNPRLAGAVGAVGVWFEELLHNPSVFDPDVTERWDHIAPRYTEFVTQNVNEIAFLDAYATEECDLLGEHLSSLAEPGHNLSIVEVGCGDGRALFRYLPVLLAQNVSYVIGLDYAPGMVREAQAELTNRLGSSEQQRQGARELTERTGFYYLNAFELRHVFEDGRLRDPDRLKAASFGARAPEVDPATFAESRQVFCCLLNTIGVIESAARRQAIVESMLGALGIDDRLIVAAFAADAFEEQAQSLYNGLEPMLEMKVKEEHFDVTDATFHLEGTPGYYSHWFGEAELRELLRAAARSLGPQKRAFDEVKIHRMDSGGYFAEIRRAG